jgi:hypothetical protein
MARDTEKADFLASLGDCLRNLNAALRVTRKERADIDNGDFDFAHTGTFGRMGGRCA